jgi:hypothetical protein
MTDPAVAEHLTQHPRRPRGRHPASGVEDRAPRTPDVFVDHHAAGSCGSVVRMPRGLIGAAATSSVSSARHISPCSGSLHVTLAYQMGFAMPVSSAAASGPLKPCPAIFSTRRISTRTQVPRSVAAPIERRFRTRPARSSRTSSAFSTRPSTSSRG